jgi:hypothetical protein
VRTRLLVSALAVAAASCTHNHAPAVTVLEAPTLVQRDRTATFVFRVDDRDGDPLTVRLSAANAGRGTFVTTDEPTLAPGTVTRAWFYAVDPGQVMLSVRVSDGQGTATVTLTLGVE